MNGSGASVSAPQSVAEVEEVSTQFVSKARLRTLTGHQLVKCLYKPGPARVITQINDQLQQLQTSSEGWQLADQLLGSSDANVRFFAALTFQVKLNNDGSVHDPELSRW